MNKLNRWRYIRIDLYTFVEPNNRLAERLLRNITALVYGFYLGICISLVCLNYIYLKEPPTFNFLYLFSITLFVILTKSCTILGNIIMRLWNITVSIMVDNHSELMTILTRKEKIKVYKCTNSSYTRLTCYIHGLSIIILCIAIVVAAYNNMIYNNHRLYYLLLYLYALMYPTKSTCTILDEIFFI